MTVKVAQWNVLNKEPAGHVMSALRSLKADIICLQEMTYNSQYNPGIDMGRLASVALDMYQVSAPSKHYQHDGQIAWEGVVILSKFPLSSSFSGHIREAEPGSPRKDKDPRVYLETKIHLPDNRHITVATTHCSFTERFENDEAKTAEVTTLLNFCRKHSQSFVLTGDTNSLPDSPTMKRMLGQLKNCGPSLDVPTWSTKPELLSEWPELGLTFRVDYILGTQDMVVVESETRQLNVSDHAAIMCTFEA